MNYFFKGCNLEAITLWSPKLNIIFQICFTIVGCLPFNKPTFVKTQEDTTAQGTR